MTGYVIAGIAMLVIGAILGFLLSIASKKFKVEEDPRLEVVTNLLPGYNCGACGESGCAGLADSLINKKIDVILCKPIKEENRTKIIEYLGSTPGPDGETIKLK